MGDLLGSERIGEASERAGPAPSSGDTAYFGGAPWAGAGQEGEVDPIAGLDPARSFADYELLEEIARGGMGVVFKARQLSLGRTVAVKMILAGQFASDSEVRRFRMEAESAAGLQHPHIVAIHEVGEYHGQHFFSMDFVEGKSLAALCREGPFAAVRAARYLKQVAEAIEFAHRGGVLHRDLKPSNILIDAFDLPRVTDFGLAKRADGGSDLTGTGQVLGTPSYMPPEQATGRADEVGPASDVYALGAILYEMVCGRPPFLGESPVDTLAQVQNDEPVPPRRLNPGVPRDLETVCLKCLQKEPARRYATASALAEDLARFLAGDPISARRPGAAELSVRWLRKQRRSVAIALVATAVSALMLGGMFVAWLGYRQWRLGAVSFNSGASLLGAEILDDHGAEAVPRFMVPTQAPLSLPTGSYELRLSGASLLSESYQLFVERGVRRGFKIPSDDRAFGDPIRVPQAVEVADFGDGADIILIGRRSLSRLRGASGQELWRIDEGTDALRGMGWDWFSEEATRRDPPRLVRPAADLDGDGTPDLVWALSHQPTLLAFSGKDGHRLWVYRCSPAFADDDRGVDQAAEPVTGGVAGEPAFADVDGDRVPDVLGVFVAKDWKKGSQGSVPNPVRAVELISGRTGRPLWRAALDSNWFVGSGSFAIPGTPQWPIDRESSGSSGYSGGTDGLYAIHSFRPGGAAGSVHVPYSPAVIALGGRSVVVSVAGTRLAGWEAATGRPAWRAHDLSFAPCRAPQFADLDGDGDPEAILTYERTGAPFWHGRTPVDVVAFSLKTFAPLWIMRLEAAWDGFNAHDVPPEWPLIVDLDGDRRPEVVLPHRGVRGGDPVLNDWAGVQVVEGATGRLRWHRVLRSIHQQVDRFVAGPDLDGDGQRELWAATLVASSDDPEEFAVFVDALSGRDGRSIWWHRELIGDPHMACDGLGIAPLSWWNTGHDGWPQLVVSYTPAIEKGVARTWVLSAGTGRVAATAFGPRDIRAADLNGDGIDDLYSFHPDGADQFDGGGTLTAIKGRPAEEWKRIGGPWAAARDFDSDGVPDLLRAEGELTAISGRDGRVLWHSNVHAQSFKCPPLPAGDLDGDGVPDVLCVDASGSGVYVNGGGIWPLQALSGKTGRRIWTSELRVTVFAAPDYLGCHDLDGDGLPEVIMVGGLDQTAVQSDVWNWWLVVLSGDSGRVAWKQPLSTRRVGSLGSQIDAPVEPIFADLDRDRQPDLVVPAFADDLGNQLRAFRGRDGKPLWTTQLAAHASRPHGWVRPAIPVVAGEGSTEVLVIDEAETTASRDAAHRLLALDGATGHTRWQWSFGALGGNVPGPNLPAPVAADLDGRRRQCVVLAVPREKQPALADVAIVEPGGKVGQRVALRPLPIAELRTLIRHDLDGDGRDEIVVTHQNGMLVLAGRAGELRWEWPAAPDEPQPPRVPFALVEIRPMPAGGHATVVIRAGNALLGLDGKTGKELWRIDIATPAASVLFTDDAQESPRVIESSPVRTVCRLVKNGTRGGEPKAPSLVRSRAPAPLDPRLSRQLPWADSVAGLEILVSAVIALAGLVIPAVCLASALRSSRWSLRRLLVVPIILAATLAFFRLVGQLLVDASIDLGSFEGPLMGDHPPAFHAFQRPADLFLLALQGLPVVVLPWLLLRWSAARRWRRVGVLAILYSVLVVLTAIISLKIDAAEMQPGQYYRWDGFAWILFLPAYATGTILLLWLIGRSLARFGWRLVSILFSNLVSKRSAS